MASDIQYGPINVKETIEDVLVPAIVFQWAFPSSARVCIRSVLSKPIFSLQFEIEILGKICGFPRCIFVFSVEGACLSHVFPYLVIEKYTMLLFVEPLCIVVTPPRDLGELKHRREGHHMVLFACANAQNAAQ